MNRLIMIATAFTVGLFATVGAEVLSLRFEGGAFLPFEPVYLSVEYQGAKDLQLDPDFREIELTVTNTNTGKSHTYIPFAHYDYSKTGVAQPTSYELAEVVPFSADRMGWLFPDPGIYYVQARVVDGGLVSDVARLEVVAPVEKQDQEASAAIRACGDFWVFEKLEGGDMFPQAVAIAQSLSDGSSGYALGMNELMAKHWAQQSCARGGKMRGPNLDRSVEHLRKTDAGWRARYLSRGRTLGYLGRLLKLNPSSPHASILAEDVDVLRREFPGTRFERTAFGKRYFGAKGN